MNNKEKLVRDLVNTFNDGDELHKAYKKKMTDILFQCFEYYADWLKKDGPMPELKDIIDQFVEIHFKPKD